MVVGASEVGVVGKSQRVRRVRTGREWFAVCVCPRGSVSVLSVCKWRQRHPLPDPPAPQAMSIVPRVPSLDSASLYRNGARHAAPCGPPPHTLSPPIGETAATFPHPGPCGRRRMRAAARGRTRWVAAASGEREREREAARKRGAAGKRKERVKHEIFAPKVRCCQCVRPPWRGSPNIQ